MIYGFFDPDHYGPKPAVRVHVRVEGRQQTWEGFIRFIIDTGADITCIRAMDAMLHLHMRRTTLLDAGQWHGTETVHGYTGDATYWKADARYLFSHKHPIHKPNDERESLVMEKVLIGRPEGQRGSGPSVLGWDVLERFNLFIDASRGFVSLHDRRKPPVV